MMSWFASNSALDEQVEKATASSLEDMALNLEISDIIRSKTVQPKEAMRSLKKRVGNKNPNIQIAALNLTDTCVKNGGAHFIAEIASREFMDNLVSLLKAPGATNHAVQQKILEVIQAWSHAFEGKQNLSYVGEIYKQLKAEGYDFPRAQKLSSTFVDSSAPPDWTDSDVCMMCRTAFTFTNRKHHCRNCGSTFCGTCSSKSIPLPHIGIIQPVRVCDGCYAKIKNPGKLQPNPSRSGDPYKSHKPAKPQARSARVEDDDDEDLKMALKMSLEEVQNSRHAPAQSNHNRPPVTSSSRPDPQKSVSKPSPLKQVVEEEEDEELKAAIAASLRDMEQQKAKSAWSNPTTATAAAHTAMARPDVRPDHELTPTEAENINLFATLVDRLQSAPPGTILREPQIQELYESIGSLRPKLARTFGETMSKYEALCDLHAKLATVVRYYDRMLEERLQATYGRHGIGDELKAPPSTATYPTLPSNEQYYGRPASTAPNYPPQNFQSYYTQPQGFAPQAYPGSPAPSAAHAPSQPTSVPQAAPQAPSQPPQEHQRPSQPPQDYQHPSQPPPQDYQHPSQPPQDYQRPSQPPQDYQRPSQPPQDYPSVPNQPSYPPTSQYPPDPRQYPGAVPPQAQAPPSDPHSNPQYPPSQPPYSQAQTAVSSPRVEAPPNPQPQIPSQQPSQPPYWQQYQKPPTNDPGLYSYAQVPPQQPPQWNSAHSQQAPERGYEQPGYPSMQYPAEVPAGGGIQASQPPPRPKEEVALIEL